MITQNELRPGNLYNIIGTKSIVKYTLSNTQIMINSKSEIINFDPIIIGDHHFDMTVLKKVKKNVFSKLITNSDLPSFYFKIEKIEDINHPMYRLKLRGEVVKVIRYFHELQNIFFSIAGYEIINKK